MASGDQLHESGEEVLLGSLNYDLLHEEDPDEFVNIEIPADIVGSSNVSPLLRDHRRRGRDFHLIGRKKNSSTSERKRSTSNDISQLSTEEDATASQEPRVPPTHHVSHPVCLVEEDGDDVCPLPPRQAFPPAVHQEEDTPLPLPLPLPVGPRRQLHSERTPYSDPFQRPPPTGDDPSLRSDMLISLTTSVADMSVRQSLPIGLSPAELNLPSDEEIAKVATRARLDSVSSDHQREYEDEDVDSPTWCQHQKHIFVLSISGKPVYSRYGKEDKLVNLFGIMQALVSFVQDDKDNLRSIIAGEHRFVFVCRGPLVFVAVAKSRQSESQIAIQLLYTYNQILSVLTYTQLHQIFDKSPGFDLRYLLQGSEKFVDNILNMVDSDPSFIFSGIRCLAMPVSLRQTITSTLMQYRTRDVLFMVLVADNQLVTYIKPKEHNLLPMDIHLILNLVDASTSFRSAESWTPICLPKFNDTGFLHAHVSYLPNDSPACLLIFSTDKEKFFALQDCQQRIVEKLERLGCLQAIRQAVKEAHYTIDHLQASEIRHFVYKSRKTSCVTSPQMPHIYSDRQDRERLFELYMWIHQNLHSHSWPIKILYHVGEKEALLGWRTAGFDLYAVFDPLIAKSQAILLGNKLIRWINKEEERLIITTSHTF